MVRSSLAVDPDGRIVGAWGNVRAAGHAGRVAAQLGI